MYDYSNISNNALVNILSDHSALYAIESLNRQELIEESERLLSDDDNDYDEILLILEEGN